MRIFLVLFFILPFFSNQALRSQTRKIDSLKIAFENQPDDTNKIRTGNTLIWDLKDFDPSKGIEIGERVMELAKKLNHKRGLAFCYNNLAVIYLDKGDYQQSLKYNTWSLEIKKELKLKDKIPGSLNNIGLVYKNIGEYDKALSFYFEALKVNEELRNKKWIATNLSNIAIVYKEMKNFEKADEYYKQALKVIDPKEEPAQFMNINTGLGNLFLQKKEYKKAMEHYRKIEDFLEENPNPRSEAINYSNMGLVYNGERNHEKALEYFHKALSISERLGEKTKVALLSANLASVYLGKRKYHEAKKYAQNSLDLARALYARKEISLALEYLAKAQYGLGAYKEAYENMEEFALYNDSLQKTDRESRFAEVEARYKIKNRELEIENLQKENLLKESELRFKEDSLRKQNILVLTFALGFIITGVMAWFIFRGYKAKTEAHKIISRQKEIVDQKNNEILDSLTYAKRLQDAILPTPNEINRFFPGHQLFYLPKDVVAGDFFWVDEKNDNGGNPVYYFAVADCTGHGVPGALVSVVCSNALHRSLHEFKKIKHDELLEKCRDLVIETFENSESQVHDGMDISVLAFNSATREIQLAGANRPLWVSLKKENGKIKSFAPDKQSVSSGEMRNPFTLHTFSPDQGDRIFLFTDGFADQFGGPEGKKYKTKNLKRFLENSFNNPFTVMGKRINEEFSGWKGKYDQVDDVCVFCFEIS
jgi:tetratricopeptide (TPR) repeat protein/serine phosphatase RsbU (regulator of sigma subunit)